MAAVLPASFCGAVSPLTSGGHRIVDEAQLTKIDRRGASGLPLEHLTHYFVERGQQRSPIKWLFEETPRPSTFNCLAR